MTRQFAPYLAPALASLALAPSAHATEPAPAECMKTLDPDYKVWALWRRMADVALIPANITVGNEPQQDIWNSFGEFQTGTPDFVHAGIDINGDFANGFGDWAAVVTKSYVWAVQNMASDKCTHATLCKLYLKSENGRYIYYYAHLKLHPLPDANSVEMSSAIRAKIAAAAHHTGPDMDTLPGNADIYTDALIEPGTLLCGLGIFGTNKTHLHFSTFDACQKYDGISPLDHFDPPTFVDETPPRIDGLHVLMDGEVEAAKCTPVTTDLNLLANVHDTWNPDFPAHHAGGDFLGPAKGTYRLTNLSAQDEPTEVVWYDFDMVPFRCAGPDRGASCPAAFDQSDFIEEANIEFWDANSIGTQSGQPYLANTFTTNLLFSVTPNFESNSAFDPKANWAILNNTWGEAQPIALANLTDGLYQVVAEVFDTRGLAASKAKFFTVGNSTPGNLVIRDNEADEGAIPSNAGGKKHWRSPNIRVGSTAPLPTDPVWSSPPQVIDVPVGVPTKVHVLVENQGCSTIDGFTVKVGSTQPSLISANWEEIGETTRTDDILAGGAAVVSFDWTPTEAQAGHSCMLAAVTSDEDETKVPHVGDDIDFEALDEPTSEAVPFDNNLGQRNMTVSNTQPFKLGNPFAAAIDLGLAVDCGDVPMKVPGVTVSLLVSDDPLFDDWANSPLVTATDVGDYQILEFHGCRFELPAITVPANTEIDAFLGVTLPPVYTGTWDLHLGAKVNGVLRDGISVRHTQ